MNFDQSFFFKDRRDAGEKLALALEHYHNEDVLVLGIPRGGIETAYYVAKHLDAELSLVVTRKLGYPLNPEAAFGAIAEDGSIYISDMARQQITEEEIRSVLDEQREEIARRVQKLRGGKPLPTITDRTIILVDDGIATGATLFATIELCKKLQPKKIVVAVPIAGRRMDRILRQMVDEVVILVTPTYYQSVSQGYEDFSNLTDDEVLPFLEKREKEINPADIN
ncbi:MAG TPA: phosphoribosyltransferase family protein [Cyclobacteriaceae bacterium]|nr:phosphoribosyltransferase family protein [Cyclobacteriaceae bacterium]